MACTERIDRRRVLTFNGFSTEDFEAQKFAFMNACGWDSSCIGHPGPKGLKG